jgi:glycosyltransferase involved in cell wall biosynthesis
MTKSLSAITILTPCYNQGPYLRQCLDSALDQSHSPFEIIASDNHSNDEAPSILRLYGNRVTVSKPDRFLSATEHFNFLLSQVSSPWATFLCGDDWIKPDYIKVLSRLITAYPEASLVRGGWHCVDGNDQITSTRRLLSVAKYSRSPDNFFESILGPKSPMIGWALNLHKFRDLGFFDPNADLLDWTAMIALSDKGIFATSHYPIAYYRVNYRQGIQEQRIAKQLADCFYIADNYLLPRFCRYTSKQLGRRPRLFLDKMLSMLKLYHNCIGSDDYYLVAFDKMRLLGDKMYQNGFVRQSPDSLLRMVPRPYCVF